MKPDLTLVAIASFALVSLACSRSAPVGEVPAIDEAFRGRLEAAAKGHRAMGRVDDLARWAPELCMAPPPPSARFSASADASTHGSKIYSVYAKDRRAYVGLSNPAEAKWRKTPPTEVAGLEDCSQVVVKEAFAPVPWKAPESAEGSARTMGPRYAADAHGLHPVERDGQAFSSGEPKGLFVMLRVDPKTPNTDDGWVYGTISADGKVTGCGRMASCMSCHVTSPHGRLFGLPPAKDE